MKFIIALAALLLLTPAHAEVFVETSEADVWANSVWFDVRNEPIAGNERTNVKGFFPVPLVSNRWHYAYLVPGSVVWKLDDAPPPPAPWKIISVARGDPQGLVFPRFRQHGFEIFNSGDYELQLNGTTGGQWQKQWVWPFLQLDLGWHGLLPDDSWCATCPDNIKPNTIKLTIAVKFRPEVMRAIGTGEGLAQMTIAPWDPGPRNAPQVTCKGNAGEVVPGAVHACDEMTVPAEPGTGWVWIHSLNRFNLLYTGFIFRPVSSGDLP